MLVTEAANALQASESAVVPTIDFTVLYQFAEQQSISYNQLCIAVRLAVRATQPVSAKPPPQMGRVGAACAWCKEGALFLDGNGYNEFLRCEKCGHVPLYDTNGIDLIAAARNITQEPTK